MILIAMSGVSGPARIGVGVIMAGFGSGYSLTLALFSPSSLDAEARFAFSLIFSASLIALSGLTLSVLHLKISSGPLGIIIGGATIAAATTAGLKRRLQKGQSGNRLNLFPTLMITGAASVVAATVWLVVTPLLAQRTPAFFLSNAKNLQTGFPGQVTQGTSFLIKLHITDHTPGPQQFQLVIRDNGKLRVAQMIRVNEVWSRMYPVPSKSLGEHKLVFDLYQNPSHKPFRKLRLFYSVITAPGANPPLTSKSKSSR